MHTETVAGCTGKVRRLNGHRSLVNGINVIVASLKIKTLTLQLAGELLFNYSGGTNGKVSHLEYRYFLFHWYICTEIGGKNLGWLPMFLSLATKWQIDILWGDKRTCVYIIYSIIFGGAFIYFATEDTIKIYHRGNFTSVCQMYFPLCEADFPYQDQSEMAKPILFL